MIISSEVVETFANGSHKAFHEIFTRTYPRVFAFVRGFIKNTDNAEDVTQTVFIKLWNKRAMFLQVEHFEPYLFMLTKHTVLNYISANNTSLVADETIPETSDDFTPHDELVAKDLQLFIDMLVDSMPPQRKLIYQLSRVSGLSNDEITQKLGIQKKTVENHLNLALKELRKAIYLFLYFMLID